MKPSSKLKKSIRSYISHSSVERMGLNSTLNVLIQRLPDTVIFGGMLREFGLGNARKFTSDIDLVSLASRKEVSDAIAHFSPSMNKFGGFRFINAGRLYDIWAFEDTWAFREGLVPAQDLTDLLKTTFFKIDAAAFHIGKNEFLYSEGFVDALDNRVLDLNLEPNPSPRKMAHKAIRMACDQGLSITPRLSTYILENAVKSQLDRISTQFLCKLETHCLERDDNFRYDPQYCLI